MMGETVGNYHITAKLGEGGMGEVYRAHDPRLNRDVAIKFSKDQFSERFEREARAVAALNHPNICQLYDVGPNYLVMEYVDGEPPKGPLPLETALNYARQIADGLEAAHEKGITHRDLKPANIKIKPDGKVKVLDFGLALLNRDREGADDSTLTMGATQAGTILGTPAYMSPEQARGKAVDKRADIWAFGVVLYEMLTGQRPFQGEDVAETLAAVINKEPSWERVPAKVQRLLKRCLEKDPHKRLRDITGVGLLLEEAPQQGMALRHRGLPWVLAGALAVALAAALILLWPQPVERPLMRFSADLGPDAVAGPVITAAISPDGRRLAFVARGASGRAQLATQLLSQPKATLLAGTENASAPFFSPDRQWIGFFADGKMKKISVEGGAAVTLCDAPASRGAAWGEDGYIIASLSAGLGIGLSRVSAAGGTPQTLTKPGEKAEASHRWPQILPGGQTVLFTGNAPSGNYEDARIEVLSLKTGQWKAVLSGGYFGRYLLSGHLVYTHGGTLFAVPFDPDKLEVRGSPAPLLEDVAVNPLLGIGQFDFSSNGTFVYLSGTSLQGWPVVWLDGSGKTQSLLAKPGQYYTPRLSPDGSRLALAVGSGGSDIFVYDPQREAMTRLTFTTQDNLLPVWTPDGRHIAFRFRLGGGFGIGWVRADGAGEPQKLLESKNDVRTFSFSPDGRRLSYFETNPQTGNDLWTLPMDLSDGDHPKPGKPELFLRTRFDELQPVFSPDGRWIAYTSDASGTTEVYVQPFPGPGGKWQISTSGGLYPVWPRNGGELFYESVDNHIMVTDYIVKGDSFLPGKPRLWSQRQIFDSGSVHMDAAPDGKRVVVFQAPETAENKGNVHVTVLLNFFDELRRRVPRGK